MFALTALIIGVSALSSLTKIPDYIAQKKEKKKEKQLETILSHQGSVENVAANVENVYLTNSEFVKYFGNGSKAQGYVKQGSGKTNAKTFINLDSETCPILEYMVDMADEINSSLAPGANPTEADLRYFTIENIKLGASTYSSISNDSMTPGLINSEVDDAADKLLGQYIANGLVEKRLLIPGAAPNAATNPHIYIINPDFGDLRTNKRYAVESGAVKFLGSLDKNYSNFAGGKITVMPTSKDCTMRITNDEKFNKEVLEKVLLNSETSMLNNGTILEKHTEEEKKKYARGEYTGEEKKKYEEKIWKPVIESFVNHELLLAPEQYINYKHFEEKYYAELKDEEDKKKKANKSALAQRTQAPVSA
ncbi:MAG: hypothetical protein WC376_03140 [Candidatus Nanoarchaeia archaeon]|jgi:hypothetical protein